MNRFFRGILRFRFVVLLLLGAVTSWLGSYVIPVESLRFDDPEIASSQQGAESPKNDDALELDDLETDEEEGAFNDDDDLFLEEDDFTD